MKWTIWKERFLRTRPRRLKKRKHEDNFFRDFGIRLADFGAYEKIRARACSCYLNSGQAQGPGAQNRVNPGQKMGRSKRNQTAPAGKTQGPRNGPWTDSGAGRTEISNFRFSVFKIAGGAGRAGRRIACKNDPGMAFGQNKTQNARPLKSDFLQKNRQRRRAYKLVRAGGD